ncbi:MAG: glycosyltransferase family 4 protein [Candidatus Pacebacteria bacterium]|nr:glycosyltransferase family 4 protein [Candidatus Paceibacterota bacterium]
MAKNQHKKILFVITKANWGGAQKYVFDLANNLKNFEVIAACGEPFGELSVKLKNAGIRTIKIKNLQRDINLWKELKIFFSLWKIFRGEKPDIVHLNSSKIGGLGALAGRLAGAPKIIFTAHGWAFDEKRPSWQIKLIKFLSWLTIVLSHKTIVLSDKELKQVSSWAFTNKKLVRIYNGIKAIDFLGRTEAREFLIKNKNLDVSRPSFYQRLGRETSKFVGDDFIIGTISELHRNKGLKYAIKGFKKVAKKFNNLKFIIIGEGEDRRYLEKKIQKYGLENKVFLVGDIKNANRYLKAFDIFILPSIKEGFPFVLLEAGGAGLPVIATKVGGVPEIIDNMNSGILVEPKQTEELATALKKLIQDENLRKEFGENLQRKIKENFSFEKMFEETLGVYLE